MENVTVVGNVVLVTRFMVKKVSQRFTVTVHSLVSCRMDEVTAKTENIRTT
jgi:hypothetical protein